MSRLLAALAVLAVFASVSATSTAAKEGVVARVLTPIPREAIPGARVVVVRTLSSRDELGRRRPFNAEAIFVRVLGVRSLFDYAGTQRPLGRYRAVVRVPSGGIRALRFGLMGWNSYGAAPLFFPIRGRVFR